MNLTLSSADGAQAKRRDGSLPKSLSLGVLNLVK